ncbi:hypothetical protein IBX28_15425 [Streptomyces sp. SHP 1-2]|nr:hypothetical protein [Streptomyces sp. SHP 1-2]MCW5251882.1 hypothetical protein [Streptomyces sp. SHP 1-2]
MGSPVVLGIESSWDGTGAGVVSGGRLPAPVVAALEHGPLPDPRVVLAVSGGHTSLLLVRALVRVPIPHLGDTLDDDAGECPDKVTRVLGPPCPDGKVTDSGAMAAAVGGLPVRSGSAPAQPDLSADPTAPPGYAALHPAARPAMAAA